MRELPSGTVTFLFTDVEGSTRLLHELGADEYAEALTEHRRILRAAFGAHGGVEVDTQGDAFFVAFPTAPGALEAAAEALVGLAAGPIRVRVGIHTGTPHLAEEGYVGVDVHRAARIAACGHGGQVLVSASTASLLGTDGLRDLGEHRLKDLSAPERIYQLGDDDLPRLNSLHQTNLPIPSTPFLGREQELAEVLGLLSREDVRLLTLTGTGGTGKTRLALQAAAELAEHYRHGLWWVPLAPLRDPELVLATAGQVLGAKDGLAGYIADKRLLLLFDNFEHLVAAAAELSGLLASCPNLDLLVTSREPLHVTGEQEYPVPPLVHEEGVGFFLARARAVRPEFQTDEAVSEICRRLDDLPLALELAAARVKALSSAQILERLEQRLPLLTGGARDLPERQRTLRATIEWSHELLEPDEQWLFARLAVFRGGCTLEAAEAVAEADLDTLQSLVDKSLVRHTEERFWMLETIREYAAERREDADDAEETRRRHTDFFLALAQSANLQVEAIGKGPQRHDLVIPEQANLSAAIDWALDADPELGLRLAVALENFWATNNPPEGLRRIEALLARTPDAPDALRARALRVLGGMTHLGGGYEAAERLYEASLWLFRRAGDEEGATMMVFRIATAARAAGDIDRGRRLTEQSLDGFRRVGSKAGECMALGNLGLIERIGGNLERARELLEQAVAIAAEIGFLWWQATMVGELAEILLERGELAEGERRGRDALVLYRRIGDRVHTVYALSLLAWSAAQLGEPERAGRLWGAIEAEEERGRVFAWEHYREEHASRLRPVTGPEFEEGCAEGRSLTLDEAVEYALSAARSLPDVTP